MEKILIPNPKEYEIQQGETLELHFKLLSLPLLRNWQIDRIINVISADKHFEVERTETLPGEFTITVKVLRNPFPLALLIGGIIAALSGFFIWGSLGRVYKIIEEPAGRVFTIGAGVGIVVGLVILVKFLRG